MVSQRAAATTETELTAASIGVGTNTVADADLNSCEFTAAIPATTTPREDNIGNQCQFGTECHGLDL